MVNPNFRAGSCLSLIIVQLENIYEVGKIYAKCIILLQIIPSVNEKDLLGHQLLLILGYRIRTILNSNVDYYSDFSPVVTTWIESLVSQKNHIYVKIKIL